MRQPKYRAWQVHAGMQQVHSIKWEDGAVTRINEFPAEAYELMQYTGFRDVCQDDVIMGRYGIDDRVAGRVIWSNTYRGWAVEDALSIVRLSVLVPESIKVLGNIHEDPNLLRTYS